jgi:hypothetical protein
MTGVAYTTVAGIAYAARPRRSETKPTRYGSVTGNESANVTRAMRTVASGSQAAASRSGVIGNVRKSEPRPCT